jgi:hypothetical protein
MQIDCQEQYLPSCMQKKAVSEDTALSISFFSKTYLAAGAACGAGAACAAGAACGA